MRNLRTYGVVTFAAFFMAFGIYMMTGAKPLTQKTPFTIVLKDDYTIKTSTATSYSDTFDIGDNVNYLYTTNVWTKTAGGDSMSVLVYLYGKVGTNFKLLQTLATVDTKDLAYHTVLRCAADTTNRLGAVKAIYFKYVGANMSTGDTFKIASQLQGK